LCVCSSCDAAGAQAVLAECCREVQAHRLAASVKEVGCTGISFEAPLLEVALADGRLFRYGRVRPPDVRAVLLRHFRPATLPRRVAAALTLALERVVDGLEADPVIRYAVDFEHGADSAFWNCQKRVVTEHGGAIAPLDLDEYVRHGGFAALKTCIESPSPESVLETIAASGLRGRGGAGYPTARKWRGVCQAPGDVKYIVCNGDEGDPGAFMDRMTLESFPYRVIEGMAIAATAVGATEGVLYIRAEYPLALRRVREALARCEAHGILGGRLFGIGPALRLRVVEGAGAFVCGEETALIAAIEGRRGMPRFRPPYPAEAGLWGKPTLINNVETFANVPWILRHGAAAFAGLGTRSSAGSKTFALAGKVVHGGLIEVPMGMTLREIVERIGGGIQDGGRLKAVQVGGPSGGCVPASLCDTPVDYEALTAAGAIMGSGGMVVLDETDCMVDVARYFMTFTQRESCGKCTFCRVGTQRMLEILERLCAGQGVPDDIERLEELARFVQRGSLCGLGRTAPNPVLSTLTHFRAEYEAHLRKLCPAKRCKALIRYVITDDCIGCTRCAQRCPVKAIPLTPYRKHEINATLCIRCDTCRKVCPAKAVRIE
jgi:NADH-quinone oxidoreductase subunit F